MLAQIDAACKAAGVGPDVLISGHSHTYQRYTRSVTIAGKQLQVPYVVVGCGGHADQPVGATGQTTGDHKFENAAQGYGYLNVTADPKRVSIDFHLVLGPHGLAPAGAARVFDSVKVDLATGKLA